MWFRLPAIEEFEQIRESGQYHIQKEIKKDLFSPQTPPVNGGFGKQSRYKQKQGHMEGINPQEDFIGGGAASRPSGKEMPYDYQYDQHKFYIVPFGAAFTACNRLFHKSPLSQSFFVFSMAAPAIHINPETCILPTLFSNRIINSLCKIHKEVSEKFKKALDFFFPFRYNS